MAVKKKPFQYKTYLSVLFSCFAILAIGTLSLLGNAAIDYYTVADAIAKIIPAMLVLGGLGWVMGSIIDRPQKSHQIKYSNVLMDELMKEAGIESSELGSLSDEGTVGDEVEQAKSKDA